MDGFCWGKIPANNIPSIFEMGIVPQQKASSELGVPGRWREETAGSWRGDRGASPQRRGHAGSTANTKGKPRKPIGKCGFNPGNMGNFMGFSWVCFFFYVDALQTWSIFLCWVNKHQDRGRTLELAVVATAIRSAAERYGMQSGFQCVRSKKRKGSTCP